MFDLKHILTPFKDSQFLQKAGVIFGVYFILNLISMALNITPYATMFLPRQLEDVYLATYLTSMVGSFGVSLLTIPVSIYFLGYLYRTADRIRRNITEPLPQHADWKKTLSYGGVYIAINFALMLPLILILAVTAFLFFMVMFTISRVSEPLVLFLLLALMLVGLLVFLLMMLIAGFVVPSMMYNYVRTKRIGEAFNFNSLLSVIKVSWLDWLVVVGLMFAYSMVSGFVQMVLCCLGPLLTPLMNTLNIVLAAGVFGAIYHHIDEKMNQQTSHTSSTQPDQPHHPGQGTGQKSTELPSSGSNSVG